jgi:hypothetical protein
MSVTASTHSFFLTILNVDCTTLCVCVCVCVCACTCRWKREDIDDLRRYAISCGKASSPIGPGHGDDEEQARGQGQGEHTDAQSNAPASADSDSQHGKQSGIVTESDKDSTLRPLLFTTDTKATDNTSLPPLGHSFTPGQPSAPSPSVSVSVSVVKGVECTSEAGRAGPLLSCTPVTVYGSYATPDPTTSSTTTTSTTSSSTAPAATMQSALANFYSSSLSAVQTVGQSTRLADWSLTGKAANSKVSSLPLTLRALSLTHSLFLSFSLSFFLLSVLSVASHNATCTSEGHRFNAHGLKYFQIIRRKIP